MVGPILETVLRYKKSGAGVSRPVAFTSFDPEVCVALRQRVAEDMPVLFLTEGLPIQHPDARRNSLQAALSFASEASLQVRV
jgi:glycerophosphoryl diester phosphodiesterase